MEGECCIACGAATQKRARRKVSECSDVLSFWEEASRKVLQESSHHKLSEALHDRFMCRKCFNAYVKTQRELEVCIFYTLDVCSSLKSFFLHSLFIIT